MRLRTKKVKDYYGIVRREFFDENGERVGFYRVDKDEITIHGFNIDSKSHEMSFSLPLDSILIRKSDFDKFGKDKVLEYLRQWFDGCAEYLLKFIMKDLGIN